MAQLTEKDAERVFNDHLRTEWKGNSRRAVSGSRSRPTARATCLAKGPGPHPVLSPLTQGPRPGERACPALPLKEDY
jgi:hypothetical protein